MLRKCMTWLLPIFFLATASVRAQTSDPDALVKGVTEEVMTILREDKGIQSGNIQKAMSLIETKVAPHFDFERMTGLAVGRKWREASTEQRKALTEEFRLLLVRTYANSLTAYRDQTVAFKPPAKPADGNEVTVRSQINKPGARPIPLDYSLSKGDAGWKVYDVTIANVSLVTNYRSSFANEIEKGGIDGLLKAMQEKNRKLDSSAPAA